MRFVSLVLLVILSAFCLGCGPESSYKDREADPAYDDPAAGEEFMEEPGAEE